MKSDTNWITEEAALGWVRQAYGLSEGAGKAALRRAIDSGNVDLQDFLVDHQGAHVPPRLSDLVADRFVHDLRMGFDDLRWQIEQQLGQSATPADDPERGAAPRPKRKGPSPGETDKIARERRALFPTIDKLRAAGAKSVTDAVRQLDAIPGNGSDGSNRHELVKLYRRDRKG